MKPTFKAYLAGFFDGEGCVMITKQEGRNGRGIHHRLVVVVTQKDPAGLFDEVMTHFGGSKYYRKHGVWQYQLSSNPGILKMLMKLAPYIRLKKDQVSLAILFGGVTRNLFYPIATSQTGEGGHRTNCPSEIVEWRETCRRLLQEWKQPPASETERAGRFKVIEEMRVKASEIAESYATVH